MKILVGSFQCESNTFSAAKAGKESFYILHGEEAKRKLFASHLFEEAGFEILRGEECFRPIAFYDVGALVWFARIIEWEFPGFSVDACFDRLVEAQRILEAEGRIEGRIHRYLIVARRI